jgi:hypothetical protein
MGIQINIRDVPEKVRDETALVDSGPHGDWAEEVPAGGLPQAPELVRADATNILRRLERAKLITTPEANAAQDDLMQLDIEWYVALAEALKLPLATLDGPFAKSNAVTCKFLTPDF